MSVSVREQKLVAMKSGGACAFPGCGQALAVDEGEDPSGTIIGEIAHIVAEHRQGPRGRADMTDEDRNKAPNLILLCANHHTIVDANPRTYSVQVLRQMKDDHEGRVAAALRTQEPTVAPLVKEKVFSTVLRVAQLPRLVYAAPSPYVERQKPEVAKLIAYPDQELVPFILRDKRLFCFHDLSKIKGPFARVVEPAGAIQIELADFTAEIEGRRRLVGLLNSALSKFCYGKGIRFDPVHHRHYFLVSEKGRDREVAYRTLTNRFDSRKAVWNPKIKATGEGRGHWLHLAAGLDFHQVAPDQWCLSIRPERHITKDGETPFDPRLVGRRVTKLKARMYNDAYLGEVHFWRNFLSDNKPRIILPFGAQSAIVESDLVSLEVTWPGIAEDSKTFTNQRFEDDLFSFGDLMQATGQVEEDEVDEEEELDDED